MTLETARFTQALLDLEDAAPDSLFEQLPGASTPFWPQVRPTFANAMSATEFTSVAVENRFSRAAALRRAALAFTPSRRDTRGLKDARALLFVVGGTTTYRSRGRERNWLVGDFADAFPSESAILQWRPMASGLPAFSTTRSLDALTARAEVRNRLGSPQPVDSAVRALVTEFARSLSGDLHRVNIDDMVAEAVYGVNLRRWIDREFEVLLDRLRPRTVLLEDAVDGRWATLVALMKRCGIHVVEPQHGWIGPSHAAYNFGAAMRQPELAVTLPDELLTFGDYWSRDLRYVGTTTAIGKPHLEEVARSVPRLEDRPREVLVVSSVGGPERTAEFVLSLADALPGGWSVRFRPHPSERLVVERRYPTLARSAAVILDDRADVYESIASARIVVGVASTVLFEALALGCRVFVRDTSYVPYIVGDLFGAPLGTSDGVHRVVAAARTDGLDAGESVPHTTDLWASHAIDNYRSWVGGRLSMPEPRR